MPALAGSLAARGSTAAGTLTSWPSAGAENAPGGAAPSSAAAAECATSIRGNLVKKVDETVATFVAKSIDVIPACTVQ